MELDEILKLTLEQLDALANEIERELSFIVAPAIDNESPRESKHGI